MPREGAAAVLRDADAVILSWHGVLFDRGRTEVHRALRHALAPWGLEPTDDELRSTRGPVGAPQVQRLLALPRLAESFRRRHGRWTLPEDLAAIGRDVEARTLEAATRSATPCADAIALLRALHDRGVRTAAVVSTPREALRPQIDALLALAPGEGRPDAIVLAEDASEPAPAPWGLFEAMRRLDVDASSRLVLVTDNTHGLAAAGHAGVRTIGLETDGQAPEGVLAATVRSLDEAI
ncbi:MAG: hypothetical protein RIS86_502 [Planctomycetota bacterium]|jgi:phosphonoacetaldehyde hydrolase